MNCSELKAKLALFGDIGGSVADDEHVSSHLETCPVCRDAHAKFRRLKLELSALTPPVPPAALLYSLKNTAVNAAHPPMFAPLSIGVVAWRQRFFPMAAGVMASLAVGLGLMNFLMSGAAMPNPDSPMSARSLPSNNPILIASNRHNGDSVDPTSLSAIDFASQRLAVSGESPSINPHGALMAVTRSLVRGEMKDDEMVIVARVFGNGLAEITDVVEPSRDSRVNADLQRAFESDPSGTPFVPASLDGRSDEVQVVLKFRSVNVKTGLKRLR